MSLVVMLGVPLIGYVVCVFHSTVLVSNCKEDKERGGWVTLCFLDIHVGCGHGCFGER